MKTDKIRHHTAPPRPAHKYWKPPDQPQEKMQLTTVICSGENHHPEEKYPSPTILLPCQETKKASPKGPTLTRLMYKDYTPHLRSPANHQDSSDLTLRIP